MNAVTLSHTHLQKMLQDYAAIDQLSHQLEKVLDYYEEHPQYPLDFNKLRQTILEVHARNTEAATTLRSANLGQSEQP
jgi:hypothetical protein